MTDLNTFLTQFPEFAGARLNDSLITAFLNAAILEVDASACGPLTDQVIYYTCAQALALSPAANTSKLQNADGSTVYDGKLAMLYKKAVGGGPRAC